MPPRLACPPCRPLRVVTAAAAERGRMRCPECETVVDVPNENDAASEGERLRRLTEERAGSGRRRYENEDEDRPRPRKKRSGGAVVLWILLGGAALLLLV